MTNTEILNIAQEAGFVAEIIPVQDIVVDKLK